MAWGIWAIPTRSSWRKEPDREFVFLGPDRVNVGVDDGGVPTHNLTSRNANLECIAVHQKFISQLRKHFDVRLL